MRRSAASLRRVLGQEGAVVYDGTVPCFGGDLAFFQKRVPGALFFLGVSNPGKGIVGIPHAPSFQADDEAVLVGARAMAAVVFDYLAQDGR